MKFVNILSLWLVTLVAYASAQTCLPNAACTGPRSVGTGGSGCVASTMWYYEARSRQCREMRWLGCGGNRNRWCTRAACEQRCRRERFTCK